MNILQLKAANPETSSWVGASAGTGKTKILTDRVLRLLLQNVSFDKILCLTFTNAACSEMQERVITHLEKWSILSLDDLQDSLKSILGRDPTKEEILKASTLFQAYLNTHDQINIYTIHSFCQKILKKFPLESGLSPNFKIIDEIKVFQIIKKIKKQIFSLPDIEPIARFFAENYHEITINEIFNQIISHPKIRQGNLTNREFSERNKTITEKAEIKFQKPDLLINGPQILKELAISSTFNYQDVIINPAIKKLILELTNEELSNTNLLSFFLTKEGTKKKRIVTKNVASPDSPLYAELERLQEKIYQFDQEAKTKYLILYSNLLSLIAQKIISEYEIYKKKNALLDYDDLIIYTENLLSDSYAKEWVLYKLDGGIDHLLVDEAQDTSKVQWGIIKALIEEFYSGTSSASSNRTIFVVGDEKQSIFSFQGADITTFAYMNNFLHKKMTEGKQPFETINLDISYRSTKEILTVVRNIFNNIIMTNPSHFLSNVPEMIAHRSDHSGGIEFWPLVVNEKEEEVLHDIEESLYQLYGSINIKIPPYLITPGIKPNTLNPKIILAKKIATYVKEKLNTGMILSSTKQQISAKDFMILFRTRDEFTYEVIKALKEAKIDTTGLDRISLKEDLGVRDLLSIAKFVLNPMDDLNLAGLLKSPIFGISEEELYVLSPGVTKGSILHTLNNIHSLENPGKVKVSYIIKKLNDFTLLYQNLPLPDFFLYITDVLGYRNIISQNSEAIDEFLTLSKNYFLEYNSGLQNFIYWFEENEISIKQEISSKNKLRIMTTHGAKGLQAPIVILCDTTKLPHFSDRFIWDDNDEMFSARSSSGLPEFYQIIKDKQRYKAYQEYLRLLYVGLTRAEDYLVICGYQEHNQVPENCWYSLIKKSMQELGTLSDNDHLVYGQLLVSAPIKLSESISHPLPLPKTDNALNDISVRSPYMCNINNILTQMSRSNIYEDNSKKPNEHKKNKLNLDLVSLEYGLIFHKILEDSINSKRFKSLSAHPLIATLDKPLQERMHKSIQKITSNNEFKELLNYETKTELSFGYKDSSEIKIGRIDLLVIQENKITVIDYKSDLNPSATIEAVPQAYVEQLSWYAKSIAEIYSNKIINCSILWLENGELQKII